MDTHPFRKITDLRWAFWLLSAALVACGSEDPAAAGAGGSQNNGGGNGAGNNGGEPDGGGPAPEVDAGNVGGSYLPWVEGNTWTYRVTEGAIVSTKVNTVGALEAVGGTGPNADVQANRAETSKADGADLTVSWQAKVGDRVLRYREQAFSAATGDLAQEEHWDPHKIHIDETAEHTVEGATWLEEYQETKLPVGGAPQTATARDRWTVIAVDQEVTVPAGTFSALVLTKAGGTALKTYYYVRGVGKVKEEGTQTEELVSFEVTE